MITRITVKAIIIKNNQLLLVKHIHPEKKYEWWAFPGGGVDDKETIFETVVSEVWEETGLRVKAGKIRFIRQFIDSLDQQNNLELFVSVHILDGKETINNIYGKGEDENYIKELKYFSKAELGKIRMLPRIKIEKIFSEQEIEFLGIDRNDFER